MGDFRCNVLLCVLFNLIIKTFATNKTDYPLMTCPSLENGDTFTQSEFIQRLTHNCRYDRLSRPTNIIPLNVFTQLYIYHLEAAAGHDLQFKVHMLVQFRYIDERLAYHAHSPNRTQIIGETLLRDQIWVPHVFITNEKDSLLMGSETKDVLVRISNTGEVIFSTRISATLYCWMNLQKFPFDEQHCNIHFESWTYSIIELRFKWEEVNPVSLGKQLHLTEFSLIDYWTNESEIAAGPLNHVHGAFVGNYSRLSFTFHLKREIGFYLLDYFIPSMMIVGISWVTFWIQADNSAPRVTLGTSTLLSFITLASAQGKNLPRVSYIKASEIWFLGCTFFIFGSLVEFAFVNTIWRQKQNIELRKVNSKHILKSTLTPKLHRKELQQQRCNGANSPGGNSQIQKSHSCSSLQTELQNANNTYNNYLTVHDFPSSRTTTTVPMITTDDISNSKDSIIAITVEDSRESIATQQPGGGGNPFAGWTTMTPQEIAQWIDKRSQVAFPCAFLAFNILYWSFVYLV